MNDIERSKREGTLVICQLIMITTLIGFWFAGKIVRGAYMVLERKRAAEKGYESPIFDTIEETHANYDACVQKALMHPQSCILIASHNQSSIEKAIEFMNK
jgi:proline dehydrogenase